jgi:hypothetical protein
MSSILTSSIPKGNGDNPWYIKVLYTYGIPSVIALGLVWFLAARIDRQLETLVDTLNTHHTSTSVVEKIVGAQNDAVRGQMDLNNKILQAMCVNLAVNAAERKACFQGVTQ